MYYNITIICFITTKQNKNNNNNNIKTLYFILKINFNNIFTNKKERKENFKSIYIYIYYLNCFE